MALMCCDPYDHSCRNEAEVTRFLAEEFICSGENSFEFRGKWERVQMSVGLCQDCAWAVIGDIDDESLPSFGLNLRRMKDLTEYVH